LALNKNKVIAAAQKFQQKGQLDKAIKELQRLVDEDPKDVRTLLKIGDLHTKKGDRAQAASTYMRVAQFYSEQGFYLKAVAVYKQILRVDQNITDVHLKLAELYHQLGLISDAMNQFQQVVAHYESKGQIQDSLLVLRKMVELDPDNIASRIKLAELCSSQGMLADAVREFDSAADYLKQQARTDDYVKVAERLIFHDASRLDVMRDLAMIYLQRGDTKRALAKLQACFKADPRDVDTLLLLARAFAALGQSQKTVSVYKELAKIYDEEGQPDQAEAMWDQIGQMAPDDAELLARRQPSSPALPVLPVEPPPSAAVSAPMAQPAPSIEAPAQAAVQLPEVAPPAPVEPPQPVEPPAPASSPPPAAAQAGDVEQVAAKLLTETDVYVKYGLKERALDHLKKVFDVAPDYEPAFGKQKSIALSMGDRSLAARSVEHLVRIALARGDLDAAQASVAELEGFLPSYAGLAALRAALGGEALPDLPLEDEAFDEVSVEISLGTDDEFEDAGPAAEEPEDEVLEDADAYPDDAGAAGALELPEDVEGGDLYATAQSLMDEAVRSVVEEEVDEAGIEPDLSGGFDAVPANEGFTDEVPALVVPESMSASAPDMMGFDDSTPMSLDSPELPDEDAVLTAGPEDSEVYDDAQAFEGEAGYLDAASEDADEAFLTSSQVAEDAEQLITGVSTDEHPASTLEHVTEQRERVPATEEPFGVPSPSDDAEARLAAAIAAAEAGDEDAARELGLDPGIGTATEIMGLSPEELAEIRSFADAADAREDDAEAAAAAAFDATFTGGEAGGGAVIDAEPAPVPSTFAEPLEEPAPVEPAVAMEEPAAAVDDEVRDPAEDFFPDEFEEADFFIRQGLYDEASDILQAIIEDVPESWRARKMLDQIASLEAGEEDEDEPAPAVAAGSDGELEDGDDSFNLAAELLDDIGELADAAPSQNDEFQYTVEEVFSEFKRGVEAQVSADDADTHYDLGIAYKEMGLVDDAISEFDIAANNPHKAADALYMIGICHMELGRPDDAVSKLKLALENEAVTPAQETAILFEIGAAFHQLDDAQEAFTYFSKVHDRDPKFKDVAERMQTLGGAGAAKKGKNISYL